MKTKKILISLLAVLFCTLVIGYFAKDTIIKKVMHYQIKDKIVCKVNAKNATQISYKEVMYQISNVSLDPSKIGGWNGIINQVAVIDKNNCILEQKETDSSAQLTIKDIKQNIPKNAKFIVSFLSVCSIKGTDNKDAIAVQVNNKFYKAVPVGSASTYKTAIKLFTEELR
ncbi:NisI/SpaI family lantibiotic immunity lipoprotein [Clostridium estertheticum]|uniref:NisI/SpaI family lantibiotic immunity lipoprotein n=1 Tax=Clostridium estertheticum TaxID=238834 RepID=UPI001C7DEA38|nr:NisI/SpaI family lantibiotic immunity lipoprotein [Clostridium estertheticum]MBX4263957.1 NisI/SpaI family lantibiotic immunity lipoprotein [Clostridium estertheticum]MBX4268102.1 NisI/SpaI family lantibiotic immunity lipoprotein [Clostridium estertheticum]WLC79966.1 NisI/SpaI family lantibiotic immunity lipoprotein [Clostridium estertheticum]WLC87070.1 NisI/SpaI family lantibiotic immunity lipoprotein [Clostridium estertheticum]